MTSNLCLTIMISDVKMDSKKVMAASHIGLFLKFSLVGCSNVAVTLGSFYVLHNVLGVNYLIASIIGYSLGILNSFTWNKLWTFRVRGTNVRKEFVKFLMVNLLGLGVNSCIMLFLVEIVGAAAFVSQVIAVGFVLVLNFSLTRFWVFRRSGDLISRRK